MKTIRTSAELKEEILMLEIKLENDRKELKKDVKNFMHSISPMNVLRRTAQNIAYGPNFKGDMISLVMSLGAGLLSRKMVFGKTRNPFKNIFGRLLQAGVTNLVAKNADSLKSAGMGLFGKLFGQKEEEEQEEPGHERSAYQDVQ